MTHNPDCRLCPLHETAQTVCIPSRGEGSILIVGQNPGAEEDLAGVPFIGKSGRELTRMLSDAGYSESEVTITNAVKCHTPKNAPPTPEHIGACKTYLKAEIHRLRPKAIVAMGDTALRALTGRGGLGEVRKTAGVPLHGYFDYAECEVWATYHPAYVLRSPNMRNVVVTDLRRVRDAFKPDDEIQWKWWDREQISAQAVAWDIETDYDFRTKKGGDRVTQLAVATSAGDVFVSDRAAELLSSTRAAVLVTHNGWSFDVPRMQALGVAVPWGDDTLVLAYLDDESQPLNLEACAVKYLGVKGWKEARYAAPGSDSFALYNARDSVFTLALHRELINRLGDRKRLADKVLFPAWRSLRMCSDRGLYISRTAVLRAWGHFAGLLEEANREVVERSGGFITNPNSSAQVAAALIRDGHKLSNTDTGKPSTSSSVLASLNPTPLVESIRKQRKACKAVTAFVKPYERVCSSADSRVHPEYTLWRTATGRTSARNLNVQQLARDPLLRDFFSAPPGKVLTTVDYAAIEFRLAAFIAGEETILSRYQDNPAWDPHRWFASRFYGVDLDDVTPLQRQVAKSANFGLLYEARPPKLRDYAKDTAGLDLSLADSVKLYQEWHETFPAFRAWFGRTGTFLREHGYIETLTGRRRHFGEPRMLSGWQFAKARREAVNMQVQSFAADVALLALGEAGRIGLPINGFFHDAISFEHDGNLPDGLVFYCMVQYPVIALREFGVELTVPLVIESKDVHGATDSKQLVAQAV